MASLELDNTLAIPPTDSGTKEDVIITEIENGSASSTSPSIDDQDSDWFYPHPTDFKLSEVPIDEIRGLKVAIVGAGLTGITAGILMPAKVPGINLTIFEKNSNVVGIALLRIEGF